MNAFVIWGTSPSIVSTSKLVLGPRVSWNFPLVRAFCFAWNLDYLIGVNFRHKADEAPWLLCNGRPCCYLGITCWTLGVLFIIVTVGLLVKFLIFSRPSFRFRFELATNFWPFEPRIPNPSLHTSLLQITPFPPLCLH